MSEQVGAHGEGVSVATDTGLPPPPCCQQAIADYRRPRHGQMIACESGHPWVFSDGRGWAQVQSEARCMWCGLPFAEHLDIAKGMPLATSCAGLKSGFYPRAGADTLIEIDEAGKAHPPEASPPPFNQATDGDLEDQRKLAMLPATSPFVATFHASPEAKCAPKWLTGPIYHAFTPGTAVCQCGEMAQLGGVVIPHLVYAEAVASDAAAKQEREAPDGQRHPPVLQPGRQEQVRGPGLARGSGSPPRSADLPRGGGPGRGEGVRPAPGEQDPEAQRGPGPVEAGGAPAGAGVQEGAGLPEVTECMFCQQPVATAVAVGGLQNFGGGSSARAHRECKELQISLAYGGGWRPFTFGPLKEEPDARLAAEHAWAEGRLEAAETLAAARHAETVGLLREEIELLRKIAGEPVRKPKIGEGAADPMDRIVAIARDNALIGTATRELQAKLASAESEALEFARLLYETVDMDRLTADQAELITRIAADHGWGKVQLPPCCVERIKAAQGAEQAEGWTFSPGTVIECAEGHHLVADQLPLRHWMPR